VQRYLKEDQFKLYQLVWQRFMASQMAPAVFDTTTVDFELAPNEEGAAPTYLFRATGSVVKFQGFLALYREAREEGEGRALEDEQELPTLVLKEQVPCKGITPAQHFTQPPPRFSEASLVKELERLGIGRPSTYASIIQTSHDRENVMQQNRRIYATMLGSIVTDKLIQCFPEIMDVKFTAGMELKLDEIEEKHLDWVKLLQDFYGPFHENVEGALDKLDHAGGTPSPYDCQKCGRPMCYRISKNGFFLSCTGYPACDGTQPVDQQGKPQMREVSDHKCPECGKEMIKRKGRFGQFLGCSGYPECKTIINLDKEGKPLPPKAKPIPTAIKCEKCGGQMVLRDGKRGPWLGCASFPKCRG